LEVQGLPRMGGNSTVRAGRVRGAANRLWGNRKMVGGTGFGEVAKNNFFPCKEKWAACCNKPNQIEQKVDNRANFPGDSQRG